MIPPARNVDPEGGFILIEVLVSALILAIVAGAVLTLVTATTHSAATQRAHSVAYALAQENQAEMRTFQITRFENYKHVAHPEIDGAEYTVVSRGKFINNKAQTVSCTPNPAEDTSDYVQLTSTVTSRQMVNPVTIESVVSPSNGSLDPSVGTLAVQTTNAAGEPLSGVAIGLTGKSVHNGTSEEGCANFANIAAGNYRATATANGLINPERKTTTEAEAGVPASGAAQISFSFDKPGWLQPKFVFRNGSSGPLEAVMVDSMEVYNSLAKSSTATLFSAPGGVRTSTLKAENLFPFYKSKYTVYAGACEKNNPDPKENAPANEAAMAFVEVTPEGGATPQIQLPALNLAITFEGKVLKGAAVALTDNQCGTKRTYVTNEGGHLAASQTGATESGLPWSNYKICVAAKVGSTYYRFEKTPITVQNLVEGTTLNVSLKSEATSTSTKELKC